MPFDRKSQYIFALFEQSNQGLRQCGFRLETDKTLYFFAVFENDECGNTVDAQSKRHVPILIDIHRCD